MDAVYLYLYLWAVKNKKHTDTALNLTKYLQCEEYDTDSFKTDVLGDFPGNIEANCNNKHLLEVFKKFMRQEDINVLKDIISRIKFPKAEEEIGVNAKILYGLAKRLKSFRLNSTSNYQINKTNANAYTCTTFESCISIQRIIATIKLYKQSGNNIATINDCTDTINNLIVSNLLSDYDHLINYHLKNKTLSFLKYAFNSLKTMITANIGPCDLSKCKCSVNGNIVDVLHSYLMHPSISVAGYKKTRKIVSAHIPSIDKIPHYQFGRKFYYWKYYKYNNQQETGPNKGYKKRYWYITQKYDNFKQEMLNNKIYPCKPDRFADIVTKSVRYGNSDDAKKLKSDTSFAEYYEIRPGTPITVENLMSVKLWTYRTDLASAFSATFRYINSAESDEELKQRNREFWHWSKTLSETVHLYGTAACDEKFFFYALNQPLLLGEFVAYFCGPASCSIHIEVALGFAGSRGIILELTKNNEFSNLKFFNCSRFSGYHDNDERLFFGCEKPLKFHSIRTTIDKKTKNYERLMPALALLHGIINGVKPSYKTKFKKQNALNVKIVSLLLTHIDSSVSVDVKLPPYVVNCFKMFCDAKETINIHIQLMKTYYKKFSQNFIDGQFDNLLNLELITLTFPKATVINIYKVGNVSDLYIDSLVMKCEALYEMNANNLKQINFHDITYNQKSLNTSFVSRFGDRFIFEAYCTISVETKIQKITNDDGTVTQIPEYSILKILRDI